MKIDVTEFHQVFFDEAKELLDEFEADLLLLESTPNDRELLNSIFRCAHSIKGGSATFGFPEVARFTHSLETLLDGVRNGEVKVTSPLCHLLLASLDQMRALLTAAKGEIAKAPNSDDLIRRIEAAQNEPSSSKSAPVEDESWGLLENPRICRIYFRPGAAAFQQGFDPIPALERLQEIGQLICVKCDTTHLPPFEELDPTVNYLSWTVMLETVAKDAALKAAVAVPQPGSVIEIETLGGDDAPEEPQHLPEETAPAFDAAVASSILGRDSNTIKVSADKLDKLINLVGELVISQSMLNAVTQDFDIGRLPRLKEAVAAMELASRDLQERVMGIRLVPIKMAYARFPRLVHDLSSACGKKIQLRLVGEETELDKNLIEAIGDPLTHLVRNSIDHGFETPEERVAAGKSEVGTLTISAYHDGGSIAIDISDDGRGLCRTKILQKALEKELVKPDETLRDDQIFDLIFQPGFSTAERITNLSGRGVGMDIVRQGVTGLGGNIKIFSQAGQGTTFRLRLPLTMAILDGQSMRVGDATFIVPLTSIVESIRPRQADLHSVAHLGEVVNVRDEFVPVVRLTETFNIRATAVNPWEGALVLVETDGRKIALLVDELLGQGQVVIKSLETNYRKVDGVAGATILGDGQVALIVDVPTLVRNTERNSRRDRTFAAPALAGAR